MRPLLLLSLLAACTDKTEPCEATGETGTLRLTVEAPEGVEGEVTVVDGDGERVSATTGELTVATGLVSVEAHRVRRPGDIVGVVYAPTPAAQSVCVQGGDSPEVRVSYIEDPASERLYVADASASRVIALGADSLASPGAVNPTADFSGELTNPGSPAFDPEGRLWVTDAGGPRAWRNGALGGTSGAPAILLSGDDAVGGSVPGPVAIAFDLEGRMFLAKLAEDRVVVFEPEDLEASGSPAAALVISGPGVVGPRALAFDADGDLWIANSDSTLSRIDAGRLHDDVSGADLSIDAEYTGQVSGSFGDPTSLAIDADGGLWVAWFGQSAITRIDTAGLVDGLTVEPEIILTLPVDVLLTSIALDEAGGLWFSASAGEIGRLAPEELGASAALNGARWSPADMAYADALAFYPPPAFTPIAF